MIVTSLLLAVIGACGVSARSPRHVGKRMPPRPIPRENVVYPRYVPEPPKNPALIAKRSTSDYSYLNSNTSEYLVNGTALPYVDWDIGESYAGLLPISSETNETQQLYFWFFPSSNTLAEDEITIWLNGGPGCSSLEGLLQENGPFIWQPGTYLPVPNPYTWVNLTNLVYVEQPVGTGFSQGTPTATSEEDVAAQFLGFWKNFVTKFGLEGRKVFITGESYAGYYVPYIADAMLDTNNTEYYNLNSIMIIDPSTSYGSVQQEIPAVAFAEYWSNIMPLNESFSKELQERANTCNYTSFMDEWLVYPPKGTMPYPPNADSDSSCDLWSAVYNAVIEVNPCYSIYNIATYCPVMWDVLGFPGSFDYTPKGGFVYFNLTSVQDVIHAPRMDWGECTDTNVFVNGDDTSLPSGLSVLPSVIERTNHTLIVHGVLDYVLMLNGTLLMIQNMTWNGDMGFSSPPAEPLYVPYHIDYDDATLAAAGDMGTWRTERGLTFVSLELSGHMVPQYQPSASYRMMEFLLGRIDNLSQQGDFTTQTGNYTS